MPGTVVCKMKKEIKNNMNSSAAKHLTMTTAINKSGEEGSRQVASIMADGKAQTKQEIAWLTATRDGSQILFFFIVSTVTILTYIKAKRTLLQPIKTEIFKEQIKIFAEILGHFSGKGEIKLREEWGIPDLEQANTMLMFDEYASLFFDIKMDRDKRLYNTKDCPIAIVSQEAMEKHFTLAEGHTVEDREAPRPNPDPRTRAAIWSGHFHGVISIPRKYVEKEEELKRLADSPLVPAELGKLLDGFMETVRANAKVIGDTLTECAKEMPEKYPNIEELKKASFDWVHARINGKIHPLEEHAKKLNSYLREYFTSDSVLRFD